MTQYQVAVAGEGLGVRGNREVRPKGQRALTENCSGCVVHRHQSTLVVSRRRQGGNVAYVESRVARAFQPQQLYTT